MAVRPGYKQTEVGVIPEKWELKRLGELATIATGNTPPTSDASNYGDEFLFVSPVDMGEAKFISKTEKQLSKKGFATSRRFPKDSILFVSIGSTIGKCGMAPVELTSNQQINAIFPSSSFCVDYLYYAVCAAAPRIRAQAGEQAVPIVNKSQFSDTAVAVPPLPEQRAIAAALSDVDALLGGLDRLIAKKRDLKQAAMQQLLTGQTRLPGFSGEWEAVEFGDIVVIRNVKVVASSTPAGTQCVELEHIAQGTGRLLMSAEATGLGSKYSFRKGDVLFGRLRAYLRKYWLAAFDGVCSTEIWPLIARDGRLDGSFLYWVVQTDDFVNAAGLSYGTHMPRSDWSVLKKVPLRLPSLPEQSAIAAVLSDMDAEIAALEARRDKTRDLKQAMMQELLTGKTRLVKPEAAHA